MSQKTSIKPDEELWNAACKGNLDETKKILCQGKMNIDGKHGTEGSTALIEAVAKKNAPMVELLLHYKANANECDNMNDEYPLYKACSNNDIESARLLLKHRADPSQQNQTGKKTALHITISEGYSDIVKLLLEHKADVNIPNKKGNTSLHWAAIYNQPDILKMLLGNGADKTLKNEKQNTAADEAKTRGHTNILDLLTTSFFTNPTYLTNVGELSIDNEEKSPDFTDSGSSCFNPPTAENTILTNTTPGAVKQRTVMPHPESDASIFNTAQPSGEVNQRGLIPHVASEPVLQGYATRTTLTPPAAVVLRTQQSEITLRTVEETSLKDRPVSEPVSCVELKKAEEIKQYITDRYADLLTEVSPQPHIDKLFSKRILEMKEKKDIEAEKTEDKQMRSLLDLLLRRPAHTWAVDLIKSFGTEGATRYIAKDLSIIETGPKNLTRADVIKQNVQNCYPQLQAQIPPDSHIDYLYSKEILSPIENESLSVETVQSKKVRLLLDMLLRKRASFWTDTFIESLSEDEGTKHLVEILQKINVQK